MSTTARKRELSIYAALCLYAALVLLLCTKSSPLFVFNDWCDANTYFTMGKGLMRGAVPYRDLFDDKGPLFYLLYGLGSLIDSDGFLGVYIVQSVLLGVTLIFCYRLARLYIPQPALAAGAALLVPFFVLATDVYVMGLDFGGGSAEEMMLPFIAWGIYALARYDHENEGLYCPGFLRVALQIGLATGALLMMKYSACPWGLVLLAPPCVALLARKQWATLCRSLAAFVLGIVAVALPYLLYALLTHSLGDFGHAYFEYNLHAYGGLSTGILPRLLAAIYRVVDKLMGLWPACIALLGGLVAVLFAPESQWKHSVAFRVAMVLSCAALLLGLAAGPALFAYSILPGLLYCLFGAIVLMCLLSKALAGVPAQGRGWLIGTGVLLVFCFTMGRNGLVDSFLLRMNRAPGAQLCQEAVAEAILTDREENRTLLDVGPLDSGLYTLTGITPNVRYFYRLSVTEEQYPALYQAQLGYVLDRGVRYVCIRDHSAEPLYGRDETTAQALLVNETLAQYDLVRIVPGDGYYEPYAFHLFRLRDFVPQIAGEQGTIDSRNPLFSTEVGKREAETIESTGQQGWLLRGPNTSIEDGLYDITFAFDRCEGEASELGYVEVALYGDRYADEPLEPGAASVTIHAVPFDNDSEIEFRCFVNAGASVAFRHVTLTRTADAE